jgi:hypothetical protein
MEREGEKRVYQDSSPRVIRAAPARNASWCGKMQGRKKERPTKLLLMISLL